MFKMPYFGAINPQNLLDYSNVAVKIGENLIELDLSSDFSHIDLLNLNQIKFFLSSLERNIRLAKDYLEKLGRHDELVIEYFNVHQDLEDNFGLQLQIETLILKRIGIYVGSHEYSIFDFSFPDDLSDRFLAVSMNYDGSLVDITHES